MPLPAYDGPTFTEEELAAYHWRDPGFLEYVRQAPEEKRTHNPGWANITLANEMRSEARKKRLEFEEEMKEWDKERNSFPQDHA